MFLPLWFMFVEHSMNMITLLFILYSMKFQCVCACKAKDFIV